MTVYSVNKGSRQLEPTAAGPCSGPQHKRFRSASVKVCGCRPHDGGAAHTGAGVRKPSQKRSFRAMTEPWRSLGMSNDAHAKIREQLIVRLYTCVSRWREIGDP